MRPSTGQHPTRRTRALAGLLCLLWSAEAICAAPGEVEAYVALALAEHPRLVAAREAHAAARERVAGQRSLPDPQVSVGGFAQSVETRVGPQRVRVALQQTLPWPSQLIQAGQAALAQADAADRGRSAEERAVREQVERTYWQLWQLRAVRALQEEHRVLLEGVADAVRGRVSIGTASLADLQQVELSRSRLEDRIESLAAAEVGAVAELRAAVGTASEAMETRSSPALVGLPEGEGLDAASHPKLQALSARADAADHQARAAAGQRLPDITVGVDWIATGPAALPGVSDSGKDAVAVGVGVSVPLWQGVYGHDVASARHDEAAWRARRTATEDALQATIASTAAQVRDTARRAERIDATLLPQARAAYDAVLGEYTVGRSGVASVLLAQRALLDLAVEHAEAQAAHRVQWARLTALTGREP